MAAHDDVRRDAVELSRDDVLRRDPREDRQVGRRRRVAEERATDVGHIELDRQRPAGHPRCSVGAEPLVAPARRVAQLAVLGHLDRLAVAVARQEADAFTVRLEQVEAFGGIRPDDQIAAADDRVRLGAATDRRARPRAPAGFRGRRRARRPARRRRYPAAVSSGSGSPSGSEPRRGPAHTRSSAGQPEHAKSLGVGRKSPSRIRAITAPSSASRAATSACGERPGDHVLRRLEELVDDLDVGRPRAHARKRIDRALAAVLVLDDLRGVTAAEGVRLVVEDQRSRAVSPEHVEAAVQEDALEQEGERSLHANAVELRDPARERRSRSRRRPSPVPARAPRRRRSDTSRGRAPRGQREARAGRAPRARAAGARHRRSPSRGARRHPPRPPTESGRIPATRSA